MPRKKTAPKKPRGIRERVLSDGTRKYDPLVRIDGAKVTLGTCDTLDEAVAMRHAHFKALAKKGEPVRVDPGILTVRQLGNLCLKETGKEWDEDRWRARVLTASWADLPATQVTEDDVRVWLDDMARTPIATGSSAGELPTRGTLHSALSLLRRVYRWGRMPTRRYVTHNPAEHVTIGDSTDVKPKSNRRALDYLREGEAKRVMDARPTIPLEAWAKFMVLMFAGCRPSDLWRLTWDRVDWAAESIRFTSTKTSKQEARDYTVHALPQLMAALREWHLFCGRRETGLVFRNPDGGVFARGYDGGWSDKKFKQRRRKQVDGRVVETTKAEDVSVQRGLRHKMGITREVPLYALKHTLASHLLLGSDLFTGGRAWSREEVQSQLGHLDSSATEHYMRSLGILNRRASKESKAALKLQKSRE
jgi:integrase